MKKLIIGLMLLQSMSPMIAFCGCSHKPKPQTISAQVTVPAQSQQSSSQNTPPAPTVGQPPMTNGEKVLLVSMVLFSLYMISRFC